MITSIPSKAHFGEVLRDWRGRRGLSQLALALEAEISQRHLSFVESGRSSPSREMVMRLAEALRLPLRERNVLLDAAGFAPVYAESQLGAPALEPALHALKVMLGHQTVYPTVVVDLEWNVIMTNAASDRFMRLFLSGEALASTAGSPNLVRLLFDKEGLRPYVSNWDVAAPAMIRQVRAAAAANPRHSGLQGLLKDIQLSEKLNAGLPLESEPRAPMFVLNFVKDGLRLSLFTMISTFGSPYDVTLAELRIESFFPADRNTETMLRRWSEEEI